jgi:uncharacterized protein
MSADLSSPDDVEAVAAKAHTLRDVELLVNNAGISTWGYFLEQSAEKDLQSIRANVGALYSLTRKLVPGMVERKRGGILNIASVVGFQPIPYWTTCAATKAFVLSFGEGAAACVSLPYAQASQKPGFTRSLVCLGSPADFWRTRGRMRSCAWRSKRTMLVTLFALSDW